jgi:hypothetical protein
VHGDGYRGVGGKRKTFLRICNRIMRQVWPSLNRRHDPKMAVSIPPDTAIKQTSGTKEYDVQSMGRFI